MKAILKLAATTLVLLCAFTLGNTQSPYAIVMGNAFDSQTSDPIVNGTVYCKQMPNLSVLTGPEGEYTISVPLNTNLCCSKENYETSESSTITSQGTHYWDPEMVRRSSSN